MATTWCAILECTARSFHRHCASCGLAVSDELCAFHAPIETDWSIANRIWNDLLMRGVPPPRLSAAERGDPVGMEAVE